MANPPGLVIPILSELRLDKISLSLIETANADSVRSMFRQGGPPYIIDEINKDYLPEYDESGLRTKWGFYTRIDGELAGLCLLGVSSWHHTRGYTGADTLPHMRGRGVAPHSKPHLFHLGFELLKLNRIKTGCYVSNVASRRSIEKTSGFVFEGVLRQYGRKDDGLFEDELRYAILREDWHALYGNLDIKVFP